MPELIEIKISSGNCDGNSYFAGLIGEVRRSEGKANCSSKIFSNSSARQNAGHMLAIFDIYQSVANSFELEMAWRFGRLSMK